VDLEQLKYFQSVANTENISQSARELYISQPTLSKALTRLEEELGYSLFNREKGHVRLNEDGRLFLDYVDRVFSELNTAIEKLNTAHNRETGQISVAGMCGTMLSPIIRAYLSKNKGVSVKLKYGAGKELAEQLLSYEVDFAVLNYEPEDPRLVSELLQAEPLYVAVSVRHSLAGRESVRLSQLREERFICNDNYVSKEQTREFCAQAGFAPRVVSDSNDNRLSEELVERNLGVYLVPEQRMRYWKSRFRDLDETVSFLRVEDPILYRLYVSRRNRQLNYPLTRDFYQFAMDYLRNRREELDALPDFR